MKLCHRLCLVLTLCSMGSYLWAADGNPAYTSAEEGGRDFEIQGEYAGLIAANGERYGVQVIAHGDGKFHAHGYKGGLPGAGAVEDEQSRVDGQLEGDDAVFVTPMARLTATGKTMIVESPDGSERYGELKKVVRKSPTLGAEPPADAIVLFDGSDVDQWNNGKLTEDKLLAATGLDTKEKFGDHILHLEFRTPFMPKSRGQARGNSGVYVQSRYELQVLDSFGLDGKDNECGGIYSVSEPDVNMCLPPLSWQTYDIEFTAARFDEEGNKTANARITVKHNGVAIHDNRELPHSTPGRINSEDASPLPLFLQDHGNPVVFRNIWAVKK